MSVETTANGVRIESQDNGPMRTNELDYELPPALIATTAAQPRDAARLMVVERSTGRVTHRHVRDLAQVISGSVVGDLMVLNRSRVVPAAFEAVRMSTGGKVGGLYLSWVTQPGGTYWKVLLESRGRLRRGEHIQLLDDSKLILIEPLEAGIWFGQLMSPWGTLELLERIGRPPLPPYIRKARRARHEDESQDFDLARYNTIYATEPGSVAAPTAGLHFTHEVMEELKMRGVGFAWVTLHVGLGTFAPIRTERVEDHPIHAERIHVPAATIRALNQTLRNGGKIIPVGTTSVRALESLPQSILDDPRDYEADTQLFITPPPPPEAPEDLPLDGTGDQGRFKAGEGFVFRFTDGLMTNFHLPRSSLMALVAALPGVGVDRLKAWYREAIARGYRFYSYGDAMLIL